jgi:16S rRNA (guanine527-N7)-methyltransferase
VEPLTAETVAARLQALEPPVGLETAGNLARFLDLLEQWNRVHNLTGIRDRDELIDRHLVESLALEPFVVGDRACDVGSGGGLPGIPLAIALPGVAFTLIEGRRKRASFLRHVAATLGLRNVEVLNRRAEEVTAPAFATVLARAVAPPAELLTIVGPLVAPGGRLVLLTGEAKGREIVARAEGFTPLPVGAPVPGVRSRIVVLERAPATRS